MLILASWWLSTPTGSREVASEFLLTALLSLKEDMTCGFSHFLLLDVLSLRTRSGCLEWSLSTSVLIYSVWGSIVFGGFWKKLTNGLSPHCNLGIVGTKSSSGSCIMQHPLWPLIFTWIEQLRQTELAVSSKAPLQIFISDPQTESWNRLFPQGLFWVQGKEKCHIHSISRETSAFD